MRRLIGFDFLRSWSSFSNAGDVAVSFLPFFHEHGLKSTTDGALANIEQHDGAEASLQAEQAYREGLKVALRNQAKIIDAIGKIKKALNDLGANSF